MKATAGWFLLLLITISVSSSITHATATATTTATSKGRGTEFTEQLLLRPFGDGRVMAHFQFEVNITHTYMTDIEQL
jgi:hypothetical protein